MPDNACEYLKPRINTYADTFYISGSYAEVNLYNNNPYVDSWLWDFGDGTFDTVKDPVHYYTQPGEYVVQVTVTDGECVKTVSKTIMIELGTSVREYQSLKMQIYPNPSKENFTIKAKLPEYANTELRIAGLNGHLRSVIPITEEYTEINTSGWQRGVYICNLFVNGKLVKTEKLVLE